MDVIKIGSSIYDIENNLLKLTEKYFLDNEGYKLDINLLKTGLFGWLIESLGLLSINSLYYKAAMDDERFPNTVSLPKNIYNFATIYQSNIGLANPAQMKAVLLIRKQDINKIKILNFSNFVIDKDTIFSINNIQYLLPATIRIINNAAKYDFNDKNLLATDTFELNNSESLYLKTYTLEQNNIEYMVIECDLFQLKKKIYQYSIISSNLSENIIYDIDITEQLSFFNVYYQETENANKILLNKYFSNIPLDLSQYSEPYCNYQYNTNKNFSIVFPSLSGGFRPSLGSIITIEVFETIGKGGNFSYTGDIEVTFQSLTYQKVKALAKPLSSSSNGKNQDSLFTIKKKCLRKIISNDSLIRDEDLINYITEVFTLNYPDNKITLRKIQDDVLRRIYRIFIMMKDSNGQIIPSNTTSINLEQKDLLPTFENSLDLLNPYIYSFKSGSYIVYGYNSYKFFKENSNPLFSIDNLAPEIPTIDYYLANPSKYIVYRIPYLINIRKHPFYKVTYYRTSINEFLNTKILETESLVESNFLINRILIQRNDMLPEDNSQYNKYNISFILKTNYKELLMVKIVLKDLIQEKYLGYLNGSLIQAIEGEDKPYIAYLECDNTFNFLNYYKIKNIYKIDYNINNNTFNYTDTLIEEEFISTDLEIEIHILDSLKNVLYRVKTDQIVNLYKNLDNLLISYLEIDNNSGDHTITGVPLFEANYITNPENFSFIIDQLYNFENNMKNILNKVENNNNFDLKFYNTFGPSKNFNIDNVNISMELDIYISVVYNEELDFNIKTDIINYINSSNDLKGFSASNLITYLENSFSEIDSIVIKSINNQNIQKIIEINNNNLRKNENSLDYIPEYINMTLNLENSLKVNFIEIN